MNKNSRFPGASFNDFVSRARDGKEAERASARKKTRSDGRRVRVLSNIEKPFNVQFNELHLKNSIWPFFSPQP